MIYAIWRTYTRILPTSSFELLKAHIDQYYVNSNISTHINTAAGLCPCAQWWRTPAEVCRHRHVPLHATAGLDDLVYLTFKLTQLLAVNLEQGRVALRVLFSGEEAAPIGKRQVL